MRSPHAVSFQPPPPSGRLRSPAGPARAVIALSVLLLATALPAFAQRPDTLATPPDTLAVPADSLAIPADSLTIPRDSLAARSDTTARRAGPPLPFPAPDLGRGEAVGDSLPVLRPEPDATEMLARVPGTFLYDFGTYGWPDGWSPFGLPPHRPALLLEDRAFDDAVTGRPLYELLPLTYLEPLRLEAGTRGAATLVRARLRALDTPRPLTEIRYRSGHDGLQSIAVLHSQQRRLQRGVFAFALGYGGHGARGEYDGSRLQGARQFFARLRYQRAGGAFELTNLYNRRRVGAQGGVVPNGAYETIFFRLGATVRNPEASRVHVRNDLALTAYLPVLEDRSRPLTLRAYWALQTLRYENASDTLQARTRRLGVQTRQDVEAGAHRLSLRLDAWREAVPRTNAWPDSLDTARHGLHASVTDVFALAGFEATVTARYDRTAQGGVPGGTLRLERTGGPLHLFVEATRTGQPVSRVEADGWGGTVVPAAGVPDGRTTLGRAGGTVRLGPFTLGVTGFLHETTRPLDLYATDRQDTVEARVGTTPRRWAGVSGTFGWRDRAERGLYLTATPTALRLLGDRTPAEAVRLATSLPEFFVHGRLGARMLLFRGDLDLDLYLQGRYWTDLRSRVFHPQTGLLVLPAADARVIQASGALDAVAEAGVRAATFFLAFENMLSGTEVLLGNLLVPDYPLPQTRFRFGVYWPIFD